MNWQFLWWQVLEAFPWVLGGLAGIAMISFGPLGRALTQRLRRGDEEAERLEAVLEELALLRGELGEVLERLDYAQRLALHDASATSDAVAPPLRDSQQAAPTPV